MSLESARLSDGWMDEKGAGGGVIDSLRLLVCLVQLGSWRVQTGNIAERQREHISGHVRWLRTENGALVLRGSKLGSSVGQPWLQNAFLHAFLEGVGSYVFVSGPIWIIINHRDKITDIWNRYTVGSKSLRPLCIYCGVEGFLNIYQTSYF